MRRALTTRLCGSVYPIGEEQHQPERSEGCGRNLSDERSGS